MKNSYALQIWCAKLSLYQKQRVNGAYWQGRGDYLLFGITCVSQRKRYELRHRHSGGWACRNHWYIKKLRHRNSKKQDMPSTSLGTATSLAPTPYWWLSLSKPPAFHQKNNWIAWNWDADTYLMDHNIFFNYFFIKHS
jgi:hypothetical protein